MYTLINPENPGISAGVAFTINKECIHPDQSKVTELIPGRALLLSIKWNDTSSLTILNVYAPNAPQDHPPFWGKLWQTLTEHHITNVDVLLSDFNITEDLLDRAPAQYDDFAATEALRNFRELIDIQDAWRHKNPETRVFTFTSNIHTMSWLDRIVISKLEEV